MSQAKQLARAGQRANGVRHAAIGFRVHPTQAIEPILAEIHAGLAFELVGEQAAAHADLAMDAPDRELDAFAVERLLPRQHVLVDAVHQRAVEIEQKHGLDAHRRNPRSRGGAGP